METRGNSIKGRAFTGRVSPVSVDEKNGASSLILFSPSSLESSPENSLEKLSYTLTRVSTFLDLKELSRFSGTSKRINKRGGISSNKVWKRFLNLRAQRQADEEGVSALRLFREPEHRAAQYMDCDQAGRIYLRELQESIRDYPELFYFLQGCVCRRTLTNEVMEVAKMIRHVTPERQAVLNVSGVLKLIHTGHLSVDEVLALADQRWMNLQEANVCDLIVKKHLSVQEALALTPGQCEVLSESEVFDLICDGVLSLEAAFELTPWQCEVLGSFGVYPLIGKGILTVEQALGLTSAQLQVLKNFRVLELIRAKTLTLERAFELTHEQLEILTHYRVPELIDKGVLSVEKALELTRNQLELLSHLGVLD